MARLSDEPFMWELHLLDDRRGRRRRTLLVRAFVHVAPEMPVLGPGRYTVTLKRRGRILSRTLVVRRLIEGEMVTKAVTLESRP